LFVSNDDILHLDTEPGIVQSSFTHILVSG